MVKLPSVGLRMLKSVLAVWLCLMLGLLRPGGMPFYSAIAAVLCTQPDVQGSLKVGLNRTVGTLLGGAAGMGMLYALKGMGVPALGAGHYTLIALALLPLMYLTVLLEKRPATYITCVVFLSVTISHGADSVPWLFALNRVVDTLIGIAVALAVNFLLPGGRGGERLKRGKGDSLRPTK